MEVTSKNGLRQLQQSRWSWLIVTLLVVGVVLGVISLQQGLRHGRGRGGTSPMTENTLAQLKVTTKYADLSDDKKSAFLQKAQQVFGEARKPDTEVAVPTPEKVTNTCIRVKNNELRSIATVSAEYYKDHPTELTLLSKATRKYCYETYSAMGMEPMTMPMPAH